MAHSTDFSLVVFCSTTYLAFHALMSDFRELIWSERTWRDLQKTAFRKTPSRCHGHCLFQGRWKACCM